MLCKGVALVPGCLGLAGAPEEPELDSKPFLLRVGSLTSNISRKNQISDPVADLLDQSLCFSKIPRPFIRALEFEKRCPE